MVLTHPVEFCSEQQLDYIFFLRDKDQLIQKIKEREGYLKILDNSVRIEKFMVKDLNTTAGLVVWFEYLNALSAFKRVFFLFDTRVGGVPLDLLRN